ncbi:hypothetical protein ACIPC1_16025 [Streptomyces sp. NPDC087263]|uniref:hypothetical protein n=1 Tax=Streptomyces sp. NPDC087263 TaxID=3365773 RepID=UPI0037FE844F
MTSRIFCSMSRRSASAARWVETLASVQGVPLLDVVDVLLECMAEDHPVPSYSSSIRSGMGSVLNRILDEGGSAYRVNESLDGLEERVSASMRDAVRQTPADASRSPAADHLAAAWKAAYGRNPEPERAYSEAIKAVESAAHAIVEPNNTKATLGTMLRAIRNAPTRFDTVLFAPAGKEPITPVEAMMRALWEGQTSRHGAQTGTVPETLESARAGVHLAAALVQWITSGAVSRKP